MYEYGRIWEPTWSARKNTVVFNPSQKSPRKRHTKCACLEVGAWQEFLIRWLLFQLPLAGRGYARWTGLTDQLDGQPTRVRFDLYSHRGTNDIWRWGYPSGVGDISSQRNGGSCAFWCVGVSRLCCRRRRRMLLLRNVACVNPPPPHGLLRKRPTHCPQVAVLEIMTKESSETIPTPPHLFLKSGLHRMKPWWS